MDRALSLSSVYVDTMPWSMLSLVADHLNESLLTGVQVSCKERKDSVRRVFPYRWWQRY